MPQLETVIREGHRLKVTISGRGIHQMSPLERELLRRILHLAPRIQRPWRISFDIVQMSIEPTVSTDELLAAVLKVGQPADFRDI
jgi:hypothetical protein